MISDIRRRSVVAMVALGLGGLVAAWLSGPSSAPEVTITGEQRVQAGTLRDVVDQLAARHRLRIVIDPAVRSDGRVTLDATFGSLPVEAQLQRLFAGHELLLHHTADRGSGARLAAAWVFARAEDVTVVPRSAATTAALTFAPPAPAAAAAVTTETARPAPPRAESADAEAPPLTLHTLRRLVEQDVSDAERVQALEALAAHPEAGDAELRQLLEQLGAQPHTLLGEQARALLDARTGAITALAPEPLEQ